MGRVTVDDDIIALGAIENNAALRGRLMSMPPGQFVTLDVNGHVGRWQRTRPVRNGIEIEAIRPVDLDQDLWSTWRREERQVGVWPVGPHESYLASFAEQLRDWDIPQNRIY